MGHVQPRFAANASLPPSPRIGFVPSPRHDCQHGRHVPPARPLSRPAAAGAIADISTLVSLPAAPGAGVFAAAARGRDNRNDVPSGCPNRRAGKRVCWLADRQVAAGRRRVPEIWISTARAMLTTAMVLSSASPSRSIMSSIRVPGRPVAAERQRPGILVERPDPSVGFRCPSSCTGSACAGTCPTRLGRLFRTVRPSSSTIP